MFLPQKCKECKENVRSLALTLPKDYEVFLKNLTPYTALKLLIIPLYYIIYIFIIYIFYINVRCKVYYISLRATRDYSLTLLTFFLHFCSKPYSPNGLGCKVFLSGSFFPLLKSHIPCPFAFTSNWITIPPCWNIRQIFNVRAS